MSPNRSSRIWRAGAGLVMVSALATACAAGTRTTAGGSTHDTPAPVAPLSAATGKAPVASAQDPQATADLQAADQSLSQIEADLTNVDQAATSGESDVPGN